MPSPNELLPVVLGLLTLVVVAGGMVYLLFRLGAMNVPATEPGARVRAEITVRPGTNVTALTVALVAAPEPDLAARARRTLS